MAKKKETLLQALKNYKSDFSRDWEAFAKAEAALGCDPAVDGKHIKTKRTGPKKSI